MKKKIFSTLLFFSLIVGGCSLSVSTPQDAGIFYSNSKGQTWEQRIFIEQQGKKTATIGKLDIGYLTYHPADPNVIFASTKESGIYYTINKGQQWQRTNLRSGYYPSFVIDPSAPALMYAASGGTIIKSSDGGQTWQQMYVDRPGVSVTALAIDPIHTNRIWAGNSSGVIFNSDDFGQTWTLIHILTEPISRIVMPETTGSIFYILSSKLGITKTVDGGATWSQDAVAGLAAFPGAMPITSFSLRPQTTNDIVIGSKYGILRTIDGGATWAQIPTINPTSSLPVQSAVLHPTNTQVVMFIAANIFYYSDDYGANWKTLNTIPTGQAATLLSIHPIFTDDLYVGITKVKK